MNSSPHSLRLIGLHGSVLFIGTFGTAAETGQSKSAQGYEAARDYSVARNGHSLVILVEGKVVEESYGRRGGPEARQMLASGSKSFLGIAAAAAVQDGLLALDDPASESLFEWQDDGEKAKITYRELLNLTSGLTAGERGRHASAPGWEEIISKDMVSAPGERFGYGAYPLNAFALALERLLGEESFEEYLKRRILDPIGIELEWRIRCEDGRPQVGGGGFMTARDWAEYGEFVRKGGTWEGEPKVDSAAFREVFKGSTANPAYGLTWWLKEPTTATQEQSNRILASEWASAANSPDLPDDLIAACGAGKQRLYVIPSRQMVIARMGSFGRGYEDTEFLRLILKAETAD